MNDSTEIKFNSAGATHSLRIRPIDHKDGEITVWEGMVDVQEMFWFEAWDGIEVWDLIEDAICAYNDHRNDQNTLKNGWRG